MPIYEYKCNNCGNFFEQLVLNSREEKEIACSKCGEQKIKKVISSFSCLCQGEGSSLSGCSPKNGFS
jgi:putative FmdB family regulatory protein